jgi:lysophospholipase L1-like esterase
MKRTTEQPGRADRARTLSRRAALLLILMGLGISLVTLEVGARLWIAMRWPAGTVEAQTYAEKVRGRFLIASPTGYKLTPNFHIESPPGREYTHNSLGFRGPEFSLEKPPGTLRVVLMGASTVYGLSVGDRDTAAIVALELLEAALPDQAFEVINAGVPGFTTEDTLLNLKHTVLGLSPDYVVVMDGRNEMFPQTYNHYVDSYDHFRIADDEELRLQHVGWKRFFRISRTALLVAARRPDWFGLPPHFENPVFGRIRANNRPNAEEIHLHSKEQQRHHGFAANLREWVKKSRAKGVSPILSTMVFYPPGLNLGLVLPADSEPADLARVVEANNEIVRSLSRELEVPLIDGASLSRSELLTDDCHFNEAGEREFARLVSDAIVTLVSGSVAPTPPRDPGSM